MPRKNDMVRLTITGVTALGSGVGRLPDENGAPGMVVFVPMTAVGDTLLCRIVKVDKHCAYGRMEQLLEASEHRAKEAGCTVFGKCGGCAWRHVLYEHELAYKQRHVTDCLARIGGIEHADQIVCPMVPCDRINGYRNKAQYPVAAGEHRPQIGFYASRSHRIIQQHHCALQPPEFGTIVDLVEQWIQSADVSLYDESTQKGLLRHLYIRKAEATGQIMVCLVCTSGKLPQTDRLVSSLRTVAGMTSVIVNLNRRNTNVVLGDSEFTLWGSDAITDVLSGVKIRLSARSFYQVNKCQAEVLYGIVRREAALTGQETVWDLYCGTGTIGLSMAQEARFVVGVEVVAAAIEDANRNADENHITNAEFLCADAGEAAQALVNRGIHPEVVVVDPPRKGCDDGVIEAIASVLPDRVVYVSCDPATLARDVRKLCDRGYRLVRATPVDMFPRTAHVETVALLAGKGVTL